MSSRFVGLRGATTIDEDSSEQLDARVGELVQELLARNNLTQDGLVSVILTATPDITAGFPATSARKAGLDRVALLGAQELDPVGALPLCVRVLMHAEIDAANDPQHVYLAGAVNLRGNFPS